MTSSTWLIYPICCFILLGFNRCKKVNDTVPDGMVVIPSGTFKMGGKSDQAYQDELPRHKVKLSSFLMDKTEVTNRQFQKFIEVTGYKTLAERDIDWEVMKIQLPPGTPKPIDVTLC